MSTVIRYSDTELEQFKLHIEKKLNRARTDLNFLMDQIEDITDHMDNDGDWMDDTSNHNDLNMATAMANRQRKHINDLENALIRIHHKTYGICTVTGQLIDARRLMAVPTTSKSVAAKNALAKAKPEEKKQERIPSPSIKHKGPKIISKVIQKPKPNNAIVPNDNMGDNYFEENDFNQMDDFDLDVDL